MVSEQVKKKKDTGKNIRINSKSHKLLAVYCKKNGYALGTFCEIAAIDKMRKQVISNL